MSSYKITNDERVEAISIMQPLPYFVHEQYAMKMLGFNQKSGLDAFVEALEEGGSLQLDGNTLGPIDINTTSADNELHFHRHRYGYKMKKSSRKTITDNASIDVVNQEEIYYSFGLFQRESGSILLKDQLQIIRHVTGEYKVGYTEEEIERRQCQWQMMCAYGNRGDQQSYFNKEMQKIVQKFHQQLGLDAWEEEGDRLELLKQAREKIIEMLKCTHVLATPHNERVCIIAERRGIRGPTGREREEQSPTSASRIVDSVKKDKQKIRRRRNPVGQLDDGVSLNNKFEDIAEANAKIAEMNGVMEYGIIRHLWESGEEKDRIEVGRRELLLLGVLANDSLQRINATIKEYGGFPYSIPEYDAMKKVNNPWRLKDRFAKVCLLISKLLHCFCVVQTQTCVFCKAPRECNKQRPDRVYPCRRMSYLGVG